MSKLGRRKNLHSFCQSRQIISVQKRKQLKVFKMQNFLKLGLFHVAVGEISVLYNTVVNSARYHIHTLYRYVNSGRYHTHYTGTLTLKVSRDCRGLHTIALHTEE